MRASTISQTPPLRRMHRKYPPLRGVPRCRLPSRDGAEPLDDAAIAAALGIRGIVPARNFATALDSLAKWLRVGTVRPSAGQFDAVLDSGLFHVFGDEDRARYADIAAALFISANTVRDHLKAIFGKTGVTRRRDLTAALAGLKPAFPVSGCPRPQDLVVSLNQCDIAGRRSLDRIDPSPAEAARAAPPVYQAGAPTAQR